jgi:hypothetical protein
VGDMHRRASVQGESTHPPLLPTRSSTEGASTGRSWTLWAVPMAAACIVLAVVLPLILGGSDARPTATANHANVNQPNVLRYADVPVTLRLSESTRAANLADDSLGQVPHGCGTPLAHAFVSPKSAGWTFSPSPLPKGPVIISTAVRCSSPEIANGAIADYSFTEAQWTAAAEYAGVGSLPPSTGLAVPSIHLPGLGQSSLVFTYAQGGMLELAVWWTHGVDVEQLILIGPTTQPVFSPATLASLAEKIDAS